MEVCARKSARFLVQNEFHHVRLEENSLILTSNFSDETIPFNMWNGKVMVKKGIIWSELQIFSHIEENVQSVWVVRGLDKNDCRDFAVQAVESYQNWHNHQVEQLNVFLPKWEAELDRLIRLPSFLNHAKMSAWVEQIQQDVESMGFTLVDAKQRMPERIGAILPWVNETSAYLQQRNQGWIEEERKNWEVLFSQLESSVLNISQQQAVLLNDDNNLILAGAGSGKTSVLSARVAYLLQSHLAKSEDVLVVAYGRDAAHEMRERLDVKVGIGAEGVKVSTFHKLGLSILNEVAGVQAEISPLATDDKLRQAWCIDWLKKHWMTPTNFKRWQKHLAKWPIAYIAGDEELGSHVENEKLIAWLDTQLNQLAAVASTKKKLQEQIVSHPDYTRLNSELSLVWPCYQSWKQMLKESGHIDFNMMITQATEWVRKKKFKASWKYIMIDEYQDISPQRLDLIEALCKQSEECSLFAVGDDWQSIYQFAGANIELTTEFANRFPHSTIHSLDTTYRFNNKIGEVANRFIQMNPQQIRKTLESHKQQKQKSVYLAPSANVEKILDQLDRQAKQRKKVLLLGRNHYHKPELLKDWQKQFLNLELLFMTCHASKGQEADFAIILSVDEGQFPAKVKALHLDGALSQSGESFAYAEERRLFYVALTRAKEKVWVTYSGGGSSFVKEILDDGYPIVKQK
ncbi:DNA helicase IV [Vibrio sp. S4M6]|uniref:DNA helicase IV n=1 Tax=Vibrio sinus TaxID=2946865 RepID=UPI00202A6EB1|nr:DNA helicase IV [Vibrio sinus]MCL9779859.1 DNA helicase IV [Vibrio sinus]